MLSPMLLRLIVPLLVKHVVGAIPMNSSSKESAGCGLLKALKLMNSEFIGRATHRTKTLGRFSLEISHLASYLSIRVFLIRFYGL